MGRNFLEERKFNAVAGDFFDAPDPHALAIAQFIELALLCTQDAAEVMGGVAFHGSGIARELFNEEASSHAGDSILSAIWSAAVLPPLLRHNEMHGANSGYNFKYSFTP